MKGYRYPWVPGEALEQQREVTSGVKPSALEPPLLSSNLYVLGQVAWPLSFSIYLLSNEDNNSIYFVGVLSDG